MQPAYQSATKTSSGEEESELETVAELERSQVVLTAVEGVAEIVHQMAEQALIEWLQKDVQHQLDEVDREAAGEERYGNA